MTTTPNAAPPPAQEKKEIAKANPVNTLRDLLDKNKSAIAMALPRHMSPDRMLRIAMTAAQKTPRLLECEQRSFLGAIVQAAQLGLEPNDGTGKAWLIPFKNNKKDRYEVQFIPGYRGLVTLARNTGEIKRFDAVAVYANDEFYYERGTEPKIKHIPWDMRKDKKFTEPGAMTHVYAVAGFKDGATQFDVMTKAEVDKIRARSKSPKDGPWVTDPEEMAKKSVVRRISKMLPASSEKEQALHKAVTLDERAELGLPQDLGTIIDSEETGTPEDPTAEERAKDAPMPASTEAKAAATEPAKPAAEASPEKKDEPAKPANVLDFVPGSTGKTTLGDEQVIVVKTSSTGRKLYAAKDQYDFFKTAEKAGHLLRATLIEKNKVEWISEVVLAPKA